jgi:hypothetical protein
VGRSVKSSDVIKRLMLWDEKETLTINSKKLKISYFGASALSRRFNLEYVKEKNHTRYIDSRGSEIKKLRKMGLTFSQIGRIYQVSRQRIEQILVREGR